MANEFKVVFFSFAIHMIQTKQTLFTFIDGGYIFYSTYKRYFKPVKIFAWHPVYDAPCARVAPYVTIIMCTRFLVLFFFFFSFSSYARPQQSA